MIFIVVKFDVQEQHARQWLDKTAKFTAATRAEPGNLWFEWSVSADNPLRYVLVEAFADSQAGTEHVQSEHFRAGLDAMRPMLSATPKIVHTIVDQQDWSEMGELEIVG
ncbi:putative quinol monooxygenase [Rhodococcus sovatensis]|uniref:Quinol monooxygenase n=1 Tax=Rhodococcus sovatensis TaxID=1805840 RepID=A0ABZ2PIE7_9NOCA